MDYSETYDEMPRVTSTHSRTIYDELVNISDHVDFRHPRFARRAKRNRSVGSAQALVVELALTDPDFYDKLRKFMVKEGKDYYPSISYLDRY